MSLILSVNLGQSQTKAGADRSNVFAVEFCSGSTNNKLLKGFQVLFVTLSAQRRYKNAARVLHNAPKYIYRDSIYK